MKARARGEKPRAWLLAGVGGNLLLLGFFKYSTLAITSVNDLLDLSVSVPHILLPLGISFYSFTQIGFLVDAWDGLIAETDSLHYAVFVSYFPHLIAGPVLHHKQVIPQFEKARTYRLHWHNVSLGLAMLTLGLCKKVLIADSLAEYANAIFDSIPVGTQPRLVGAWCGAFAYTFQLYFDFSGYSDMAVGLSLLFNVRLPFNFNSPYKAANIIDFWRRWHMTLSSFLRDYLYIRLGGNRLGESRRMINLMTTMLLGGLWHGANWTFVAWGGVHGIGLIVNHWFLRRRGQGARRARALGAATTFLFVTLAWVIFRSTTFHGAFDMFQAMAGTNGIAVPDVLVPFFQDHGINALGGGFLERGRVPYEHLGGNRLISLMVLCATLTWFCPNSQELLLVGKARAAAAIRNYPMRCALGFVSLYCIVLSNLDRVSTFLYYQF